MDLGRLGLVTDPETGRGRVWALIVVWRYSRHCFVWPTTSQQPRLYVTPRRGHRRAVRAGWIVSVGGWVQR